MAFFAKRSRKEDRGSKAVIKDSPRVIELDRQYAPEKIVIVSAHPFGAALKYLLLGALAGAGATYFALKGRAPSASASGGDAVAQGLAAGGAKAKAAKNERALLGRAMALAGRVKSLSGVVGRVKQFAGDTLAPAVSAAMDEGKRTAREVEAELKQDLEEAKREAEAEAREAEAKRDREHDHDRDKKRDGH